MINSISKINNRLPSLLEQQISPPYRIVSRHLTYLQKWREYLLWIWSYGSDDELNKANIQQSVDELLSIIMLIDYVWRLSNFSLPSVGEILKIVDKPTSHDLCKAFNDLVSDKILQEIFNPHYLISPDIEPNNDFDLLSLVGMSKAVETVYNSHLPITFFGDFYQLCLSRPVADTRRGLKNSPRRIKGVYYTPAALVDYIVFRTLGKICSILPEQIQHLRILDPSCGCGAFLIASLRFLLKCFEERDDSKKPIFSKLQKSLNLLKSSIYGVDIDRRSIYWTRRLLLLTIWDFCIRKGIDRKDISKLYFPTFEGNLICRNFLDEDFLKEKAFNVLIGGPPFVRVKELYKTDPVRANNYKERFKTARSGQFDLYMLFIEKSIELLANQGYLGMSVSNTFLRSGSGGTLRKLIKNNCNIEEIVEFEDSRLYSDALVQVATIIFQKTAKKNAAKYVLVKGEGDLRRKLSEICKGESNVLLQVNDIHPSVFASEHWKISSTSENSLLLKIYSKSVPLVTLPVQIRLGAATGADEVFLLNKFEYLDSNTLLAESRFLKDVFLFESSILRPILRGRNIKSYDNLKAETMCVFPYDKTGNLITEDILKTNYRSTYKYLKLCQSYLSSKKLKENQIWYSFRGINDISHIIQSPKILGSVINSGGGFTLDENQDFLCSNSVVLVYPNKNIVNPYFLLAVLNSNIFRFWIKNLMPRLGFGWYSYRINVLREFPVPNFNREQNKRLFNEVINHVKILLDNNFNKTDRSNILSEIDCRIYELYGIPKDELYEYIQN